MMEYIHTLTTQRVRQQTEKLRPIRSLNLRHFLLILFSLALLEGVGHCSISVMPMEMHLKAPEVGSRLNDDIEVFNPGNTPVHVTTSVMDWALTETGDLRFTEAGTQPRSAAPWIQLNPMSFAIPPKQSVRVRYSIIPPHQISQEHWAMIFFQTRPMPTQSSRVGLNVSTRVGCKMFVAPNQDLPRQGRILDMDVQPVSESELKAAAAQAARINRAGASKLAPPDSTSKDSGTNDPPDVDSTPQLALPTKVRVLFENTSALSIRVQGTVEARDADGQLLATGILTPAKAQILSGAKRELWGQLDKPLVPGTYQFKAIIDHGAKELMAGELKAKIAAPSTAIASSSAPAKDNGEG